MNTQGIRSGVGKKQPMNKRGISPLVATVLLLAFAVAAGTMVVSYLSESLKTKPCDNVGIGTEGGVTACYKDEQVTFIATNTGKKPIVNLKVRLINANTKDVYEPQLGIALDPGSAAKVTFPYQTISPESIEMTVIPVVQGKDSPEYCADSSSVKIRLAGC